MNRNFPKLNWPANLECRPQYKI